MKKVEIIKNAYGINIKKCCASCMHKVIGKNAEQRICMKGEGEVPKNYLCPDWAMSDQCKEYKTETFGRIKKPHYIAWLKQQVSEINSRDISQDEAIRIMAEHHQPTNVYTNIVERTKMAMIGDLPRRYEKIIGSRFV